MQFSRIFGLGCGVVFAFNQAFAFDIPRVKSPDPVLFDGETHPVGSSPGGGSTQTTGAMFGPNYHAQIRSSQSEGEVSVTEKEFYEIANLASVLYLANDSSQYSRQQISFAKLRLTEKLPTYRTLLADNYRKILDYITAVDNGGRPSSENRNSFLKEIGKLLGTSSDSVIPSTAIYAVQIGTSLSDSTSIGYGSLFIARPETRLFRSPQAAFSYGLNALAIPSIGTDTRHVTYRVGATTAFGNPNFAVLTLNYGYYLSPDVRDAEVRLSEKVGGSRFESKISGRHVFDFVRAGDFWLTESGRSLSSQQCGTAAELSLTYGLPVVPGTGRYKDAVPSVSLSVTYSEQKELGLDEGAIEFRCPVKSNGASPIFVTSRYGTRGNGSLGLAFSF